MRRSSTAVMSKRVASHQTGHHPDVSKSMTANLGAVRVASRKRFHAVKSPCDGVSPTDCALPSRAGKRACASCSCKLPMARRAASSVASSQAYGGIAASERSRRVRNAHPDGVRRKPSSVGTTTSLDSATWSRAERTPASCTRSSSDDSPSFTTDSRRPRASTSCTIVRRVEGRRWTSQATGTP